jgi:predicted DNA-binding protein
MSADNWRPCPVCERKAAAAIETRRDKLASKYGKIPAAEFVAESAAIESDALKFGTEEMERTLREDFEQGIDDDGDFYLAYSGYCSVCKTEWKRKDDAVATKFSKESRQ